MGTQIYAIYKWHELYGSESPLNGVCKFEIHSQTEELIKKINEFKENKDPEYANELFRHTFYELMAYYGRLSAFQEEDQSRYPDPSFPRDLLIDTFGIESIDLYSLLHKMDTYQNAKNYLKGFRELKEKIISKINRDRNFSLFFLGDFLKQMSLLEQKMSDLKKPLFPESLRFNVPKIPTVWEEIIPLLKKISKNTEEIKNSLNEIKSHFDKK